MTQQIWVPLGSGIALQTQQTDVDGTRDRRTVCSLVVHRSVLVRTPAVHRLTQHCISRFTLNYMFRLFHGHDPKIVSMLLLKCSCYNLSTILQFEYNATHRCVNSLYILHFAVSFVWHVVNSCCVLSNLTDATKIKISVLIILRTIHLHILFLLYCGTQPQDGSGSRNM
jgi:hypothetical protein